MDPERRLGFSLVKLMCWELFAWLDAAVLKLMENQNQQISCGALEPLWLLILFIIIGDGQNFMY